MHVSPLPPLTHDEIDDVLYYARVNDADELQQTLNELGRKYQCQPGDTLKAAVEPESGNTVLHYCAANGFAALLPRILQQIRDSEFSSNADDRVSKDDLVNRANRLGNTALHWGALNGHLAVVRQLVEAGADVWTKNSAGHLAMFEAERADKGDVVQYLLVAGGKEVEQIGNEREDDVERAEETGGSINAATG